MASARLRFPRPRLAQKIIALSVFSVALTIVYFGYVSYRLEYRAEEERFGLALERIAATAVLAVDGEQHRTIRSQADTQSPAFRAVRDQLRRVQRANYLKEELIYTFYRDDEGTFRFAVMLQEKTYTGDAYPSNAAPSLPSILSAWREKRATHSGLYKDAHGTWVSGFAPILDGRGEVEGILEVDYPLEQFTSVIMGRVRTLVLISLVGLAAAVALSSVLAVGVIRALRRIRRGAEAILRNDYSHRIRLDRSDELGLVAQQFNKMAETLAERFEMLKYLPRHTLEAIERRTHHGDEPVPSTTERVSGAVLFSDIRGYTALSSEMSAEAIVLMLNHYLRRQAEIIEQHGGVIDKFIGDAVLAMFRGDRASHNCVAAAIAIRAAIDELNTQKVFACPVYIGMGIAAGELVLGEIGSAQRRERTPIGTVVNLASRLCSRAGSAEILVSDPVRTALGTILTVENTQAVVLKGFADPQLCHQVVGLQGQAL